MRRIISRVLFGLTAALCVAVSVQAAGINSAEQRLLDAASQPFSYDGKTYVVNGRSISAARAKLSEESMDLTDSFADECISQFRQSYAELVSGGYCEEIEDSDNEDLKTDPEATPEPKHSKSERARNKAFLRQILGDPPDSSSSEEKSPAEGSGDQDEAEKDRTENNTGNKTEVSPSPEAVQDEWDDEKNTLAEMEFDSQDVKNAVEKQLTVAQGSKQYTIQTEDGTSSFDRYLSRYLSLWKKVLVVLVMITVGTAAVMANYILAARGRHEKKGKKRSVLAALAGACIAGWSFLLIIAAGMHFGVFNKGVMHRQLMESDYFSGVTQMARKQAAVRLEDNGYDSSIADEVFDLSNVYIDEKQYIDAVLSGEKGAEISVDKIHEKLLERLDGEKDATLIRLIEEDYTNISDFNFGSRVRNGRDSCTVIFYLTVILGIAALCLLFVLVYFIYRHLYKAVGIGAAGLLPASLASVFLAVLVKYVVFRQELRVKPMYYQDFLQNYISWDIQVVFYFGCIGVLCAVSLFVWRYHLRKFGG